MSVECFESLSQCYVRRQLVGALTTAVVAFCFVVSSAVIYRIARTASLLCIRRTSPPDDGSGVQLLSPLSLLRSMSPPILVTLSLPPPTLFCHKRPFSPCPVLCSLARSLIALAGLCCSAHCTDCCSACSLMALRRFIASVSSPTSSSSSSHPLSPPATQLSQWSTVSAPFARNACVSTCVCSLSAS